MACEGKPLYLSNNDADWGDDEGYAIGLAWDNIRYGKMTDAWGNPNNPVQDQPAAIAIYGQANSPGWPNWHFGSAHSGVFRIALADGSVRTVSYGISLQTQFNLCNRMDGTVLGSDF